LKFRERWLRWHGLLTMLMNKGHLFAKVAEQSGPLSDHLLYCHGGILVSDIPAAPVRAVSGCNGV
ncbi:MAG: hypothetical protein Q9M30_08015, partial [Mariprofundaceae bacterium]|nr:hypothetical protein [Mariprofundaceae bacterium]